MAGVAGEVALARDQVAGAPGQVAQRAGQLVDLAAAFARYALRRDGLHVQVARIPSRDLPRQPGDRRHQALRSEEHTSELQSLMRISYAVFCLKKKKPQK